MLGTDKKGLMIAGYSIVIIAIIMAIHAESATMLKMAWQVISIWIICLLLWGAYKYYLI